ncbi:BrnT family toxin [Mangrovicella endophytica]|uniref:BrnT family toxin n=1 Tax=Mangrovicella endophytica TaxID=2066697 RepID=UPI000C9E912B|nr:BrnT family toxin [Mangrovicella endophytica]
MRFEWDETKDRDNIAKHGVSFAQAAGIFHGFTLDWVDDRFGYGEVREISIGLADGVAILVVVHTDRDGVCRLISARPALRRERKLYEQAIRNALER